MGQCGTTDVNRALSVKGPAFNICQQSQLKPRQKCAIVLLKKLQYSTAVLHTNHLLHVLFNLKTFSLKCCMPVGFKPAQSVFSLTVSSIILNYHTV